MHCSLAHFQADNLSEQLDPSLILSAPDVLKACMGDVLGRTAADIQVSLLS